MKVIGEKDEAILMVGSVISFPLNPVESDVSITDGKCREVVKRKIEKNKISQTTTTSNCPVDLKKLEGQILQELDILPEKVIYKRTEKKSVSTCLYKRKLN